MLVEETLRTFYQYLADANREESEEHKAKTYHILVLQGKLRTAIRWITDLYIGGVLHLTEIFTKTGRVCWMCCATNTRMHAPRLRPFWTCIRTVHRRLSPWTSLVTR